MNEKVVVFDTSILIDHMRTNCHAAHIASINGLVRFSSVVLAEMWRGIKTDAEKDFLRRCEKNYPILTPTRNNWLESGLLLAKMRAEKGFDPAKLRDLHFDVLIALTVRSHGARLITSNRADFELICQYREFNLEVW